MLKILGYFAIIVIFVYLVQRVWAYFIWRDQQIKNSEMRPPLDYMQKIGIKCPDYWTYVGDDSDGNYRCVNTFGLNVKDTSKCYTTDKEYVFKALQRGKDWATMTDKQRNDFVKKETLSSGKTRCDWLNECGGVWLGVKERCN